jgi:hypothetical protein
MSTKISQLTSATDITASDLMQIVDVEDGVMAPSGTNKKVTASLLAKELAKQPLEPGIVISGSSSGDAVRITQTGSGNALVVEDSTNPDSTPFVVAGNGHVGIGTSSPQVPLDIANCGIRINSSRQISSNADNGSLIVFGGTAGNGANIELYGGSDVNSPNMAYIDADVTYLRSADGASEKMRITSAGNVGIGTNTPVDKLSVNGPIHIVPATTNSSAFVDEANRTNTYLSLQGSAGQTDFAYLRQIGTGDNDLTISLDLHDDVNDPSGGQAFAIRNVPSSANPDSTPITNFIVNGNGNVGIGTATPEVKLEVAGEAKASSLYINNPSGDSKIEVGGAGNVYIDLKTPNSDDYDLRIGASATGNTIESITPLYINSTSNQLTSIAVGGGNVGIGTGTPSSKLHINGDLTMSSATLTTSATPGANGDVPAQVGGYLAVNLNGVPCRIPYYPA